MNKKQLIVAWVMAVIIFVIILVGSKSASDKNKYIYDIFKATTLIIGGMSIFMLRNKK